MPMIDKLAEKYGVSSEEMIDLLNCSANFADYDQQVDWDQIYLGF